MGRFCRVARQKPHRQSDLVGFSFPAPVHRPCIARSAIKVSTARRPHVQNRAVAARPAAESRIGRADSAARAAPAGAIGSGLRLACARDGGRRRVAAGVGAD